MIDQAPLTIASQEELAGAIEENLFALFRMMAAVLADGELYESETFSRHATFPQNPMFKGIWRTRLPDEEADRVIDEQIAWFREHRAPSMFWWTGPGTHPADLGTRLERRGLISMEDQRKQAAAGLQQTADGAPGMVADMTQLNRAALQEVPKGFTIEEVLDEDALYDFKKVFVEAYGVPDWAGQAWVDAALRAGIGCTPWIMYLGRLNGEPVATSMLFNGGGVAGLYGVATAASARGRGIGGAITLRPLLDASEMGYRYAVLFSSEMGVRAYERIGFRLTDVRINRYLWRND